MNLDALNDDFGIPGKIQFEAGHGGLPMAKVSNDNCLGEMYLHGAHVTGYQPLGSDPLLWMSGESFFFPDKPIRGGVPLCWPWFGAHPTDPELPQHGLARIADWDVASTNQLADDTSEVVMRLTDNAETRAAWAHPFELMMRACFGEELTLELTISNSGDEPFDSATAIHTYFAVENIEAVTIRGLAGRQFTDQLDNNALKLQSGSLRFRAEVDRVYVDSEDDVVIEQEGRPAVHVSKTGSRSTVVWNPWIAKSQRMPDFPDDGYQTMVCVETTNAESDVRTLQPGRTHVIRQVVAPVDG